MLSKLPRNSALGKARPSSTSDVGARTVLNSKRNLHIVRSQNDAEPDMIERMVGFFFGQKALNDPEPFGLKRLNFDELPDQKVEMVEEAPLLETDKKELLFLRPLLAKTQLEKLPLRQAYNSIEQGWNATAFHQAVDGFGAALVLGKTEGGAMFGGYNPEGWISFNGDASSNGAFLFTWPDGDTSKKAIKLPKIGGPALAILDKGDKGPCFGAEGLTIPMLRVKGQENIAKSRLGTYYARMPDNTRHIFAPTDDPKKTKLKWLQAWVSEGPGVQWELDGLRWKSSLGPPPRTPPAQQ